MTLSLLKRTIISIILAAALLPVSLAFGGLPGPPPPALPPIPKPPDNIGFTKYQIDTAPPDTQIEYGTPGSDMIAEYGGTENVTQIITGNTGDDWLLQVGGEQKSTQRIDGGSGNKTFYQFGGQGDSTQIITSGDGIQTFIQVGGQRNNALTMDDGANTGTAYLEQYGGAGNNNMAVTGSHGDDIIKIYGGQGNNTMIYNITDSNDLVTILGTGVDNTLTMNNDGLNNYKLQDYQGHLLFQKGSGGSTITVANLQRITVLAQTASPSPPITPALCHLLLRRCCCSGIRVS